MAPIALAEPSGHYDTVQTWTLDSYGQLAGLRAGLWQAVRARGGALTPDGEDVVHGLVLAGSELATNALKHARPPATVTLRADSVSYLLEVSDTEPGAAPLLAQGRAPGEGGFGLVVVRRVARSVGWYRTRSSKHVWAAFPPHGLADEPTAPRAR